MNQNLIGDDWFNYLKEEFEKEYFEKIRLYLRHEYSTYKCYPAPAEIFKAFKLTPPDRVKVIILGQD